LGDFKKKDLFFTKANQLLKEKSNEKNSISTCTFCFVLSCKSKQLAASNEPVAASNEMSAKKK
jgi:hypothetical protein